MFSAVDKFKVVLTKASFRDDQENTLVSPVRPKER